MRALDFSEADLILAMDAGHLEALRERCPPQARHKLALLLDHAPDFVGRDVPDPYYGDESGFIEVLDLAEEASRRLVARLCQDPGAAAVVVTATRRDALRDVDGDGQVDVITSAAGGTVYVLRNLGGGVLEIDKLWARYGAAPGARALVLAQLDGDGRPDLLTANRDASTLSLLRGGPGGLFQRPALGFGTEAAPVALAALDLDGDGRADLAVACQGSAHLQVLLSRL